MPEPMALPNCRVAAPGAFTEFAHLAGPAMPLLPIGGMFHCMKKVKSVVLAVISVVALLGVSACVESDANNPGPGEGTGNTPVITGEPTIADIETEAPTGGAAAKIGENETVISRVSCTVINDMWTMSGSDDQGAKVAVTGAEDRSTVDTASIVLNDGTVVQVMPGLGSATIEWEGETFTVTGRGELLNLNDPEPSGEVSDFIITATCE